MRYAKKLVREYLAWAYSEKQGEEYSLRLSKRVETLSKLRVLLKDIAEILPPEDVVETAAETTKETYKAVRKALKSAGPDEWGIGRVWAACFSDWAAKEGDKHECI